jgi:hypothetical protein
MDGWMITSMPGDIVQAVSETGYTDNIIGLQWLHYFERLTCNTLGTHCLLLLDGHGSHMTSKSIDYCDKNNIIPYCLPHHSTHLMQPLDLVVFSPYKHWHQEAINHATCTGCTTSIRSSSSQLWRGSKGT